MSNSHPDFSKHVEDTNNTDSMLSDLLSGLPRNDIGLIMDGLSAKYINDNDEEKNRTDKIFDKFKVNMHAAFDNILEINLPTNDNSRKIGSLDDNNNDDDEENDEENDEVEEKKQNDVKKIFKPIIREII